MKYGFLLVLTFYIFAGLAQTTGTAAPSPTETCPDIGNDANVSTGKVDPKFIGNIHYRKFFSAAAKTCVLEITFEDPVSKKERHWTHKGTGDLTMTDLGATSGEYNQVVVLREGSEPKIAPWLDNAGTVSQNGFTLYLSNGEKINVDAKNGKFLWEESYEKGTTSINAKEFPLSETLQSKNRPDILQITSSDKDPVIVYPARVKGHIPMDPLWPVLIISPNQNGTTRVCRLKAEAFFSTGRFNFDKKNQFISYKPGRTRNWDEDYSPGRIENISKYLCTSKNTTTYKTAPDSSVVKTKSPK